MKKLILSSSILVLAACSSSNKVERSEVLEILESNKPQFKKCYSAKAKKHRLDGDIVVIFEVASEGKVRSSKIKSTTIEDKEIQNCLTQTLSLIRFPAPPEDHVATIEYAFSINTR